MGGGIAGLAAAHVLCETPGVEVHVHESESDVGGQARSMMGKRCSTEYSWRIFAACYKNLNGVIRDIGAGANFVTINPCIVEVARVSYGGLSGPNLLHKAVTHGHLAFANRVLELAMICRERAVREYDHVNAFDHYGRDSLAKSILGPFLGLDAVHTSLSGFYKNVFNTVVGNGDTSVSKYPTQESLFEPWKRHLAARGVAIHTGSSMQAIRLSDNRVRAIVINGAPVEADEFLLACSLKSVSRIFAGHPAPTFAALRALEPSLQLYYTLNLYFSEEVGDASCTELVLVDMPWQPIIQRKRNWKGNALELCDGIRDVWNVGFLDYTPGLLAGKILRDCSRAEAIREGLHEVESSAYVRRLLRGRRLADVLVGVEDWHQFHDDPRTGKLTVSNPKFSVNVGTAALMPARSRPTDLPVNLGLAGYYVASTMGGVSMEASCETGMRAARDLLSARGLGSPTPYPHRHTNEFVTPVTAPLVLLDRLLYAGGLPPLTAAFPPVLLAVAYCALATYAVFVGARALWRAGRMSRAG